MPTAAQQRYALMADVQEEVNGCAIDWRVRGLDRRIES